MGPSPSTGNFFVDINGDKINNITGNNLIEQLYRVQSYSYDMNNPNEIVNQIGELSEIDQVTISSPIVTLSFNYLLANFENEKRLGFTIDGSDTCIKNILNKTQDDKCYFIRSAPSGIDGVGDQTTDNTVSILGFGNGYITSYSTEGRVGSMPTASVSMEGLNAVFSQMGTSGYSPSIDPNTGLRLNQTIFNLPEATTNPTGSGDAKNISVLRPGDITVTLTQADSPLNSEFVREKSTYSTMGTNLTTARVQGYSLGFDLSRTAIEGLGSRYAFDREVSYPSVVNFSIDALAGDLNTGSWNDLIECTKIYDVQVDLKDPKCYPSSRQIVAQYLLKNARMISYSSSMGIGDNQTVNIQFQSTLAGSKSRGVSSNRGLFMVYYDYDSLSMIHAITWDSQDMRYESMNSKDLAITSGGWNSVESTDFAVITDITGGANWQTLTGINCNIMSIINDTSYQVEVRKNTCPMIPKTIQPSSIFEISAITNSNQVDVRRFDRSSTPLSISWEWQKYN